MLEVVQDLVELEELLHLVLICLLMEEEQVLMLKAETAVLAEVEMVKKQVVQDINLEAEEVNLLETAVHGVAAEAVEEWDLVVLVEELLVMVVCMEVEVEEAEMQQVEMLVVVVVCMAVVVEAVEEQNGVAMEEKEVNMEAMVVWEEIQMDLLILLEGLEKLVLIQLVGQT